MLIGFSLSAFLTEIETLFYHFFSKYPEWYIYLYFRTLVSRLYSMFNRELFILDCQYPEKWTSLAKFLAKKREANKRF